LDKITKDTILTPYIKGKTVSIVGAAESLLEYGKGEEIDSRDVVIRVNITKPIPPEHYARVGKRTDVIYCNYSVYGLAQNGLIMGIPAVVQNYDKHLQEDLRRRFGERSLDGKLGCYIPSSGLVCIYTAVISGAKDVYVTGFDFFRTGRIKNSDFDRVLAGDNRWCIFDGAKDCGNDFIKDEHIFKHLVKDGYPLTLDEVLEEICRE